VFELRPYTFPYSTRPLFFNDGIFFWDRVLQSIGPRLASNLNPPDLCLLSSYDYRREPLIPGHRIYFVCFFFLLVLVVVRTC
jgi:hypothetical protein